MTRKNPKTIGKVVLRSVPNPEIEAKVAAFLARLMKGTPAARIRSRIKRPPIVLAKKITADKGKVIVDHLEKLGAKASFVPLRPGELKKSEQKTASPKVSATAVEIVPPPHRARKKRLRYAAAGLLMIASLVFLGIRVHDALIRPTPSELVFRPIDFIPEASTQATPENVSRLFDLRYRLHADRRLIDAFAVLAERFPEMHGQVGSEMFSLGAVQTNARQCLLPLMAAGKRIGELRLPLPLPFADAMAGLDRWHEMLAKHFERQTGRTVLGRTPASSLKIPADAVGGPVEVLAMLQRVQRSWNRSGPDCGLVQTASRGYALLATMLHPDRIGAADKLYPFALALTAACPSTAERSRRIDRALLGRAMGYRSHGENLKTQGPAGSQDRMLSAFLGGDTKTLSSAVAEKTPLAGYLLMRLYREGLQNRSANEVAERLLDDSPDHFPALADAVFAGDLSTAKQASILLPVFLFLRLEAGPLPTGGVMADWTPAVRWFSGASSEADLSLARFEAMLEEKISGAPDADFGLLLDAQRAADVWRCYYLNAMFLRYRLLSDRWDKPRLAEAFAELLAQHNPRHPLVMSMLAKTARHFGRSEEARAYLEELLAVSQSSGALLTWVYDGLSSESEKISYWPRVFDRLDGRPAHLAFSGNALFDLMSLDLSRKYTAAALKLNRRFFGGIIQMARITGADRVVGEALQVFPGEPALRLAAADYFAASGKAKAEKKALALYREIHRLLPENFHVTRRIFDLFRELNRAPEAAVFVESRLESEPPDTATEEELRRMLAWAFLDLKEPRKALGAIEGKMDTFDPEALLIASLANEALGNFPRARELMRLAAMRGKNEPEIILSAASFFWRRGHDRAAAGYIAALRSEKRRPPPYAEEFVGALSNVTLKRLRQAINTLVENGAGFEEIHRIAVHYAGMKKDAIALEVLAMSPVDSAVDEMNKVVSRFQIISTGQGRLKALQFLADTVPPAKGNLLGRLLYERGMFDALLGEFIQPEAHPVGLREKVWLYRLIAWLATDEASRSMGTFLEDHYLDPYEPAGDPDHPLQRTEAVYHATGRYLMGKMTAESLLAVSPKVDHRAMVTYFIGLSHRLGGEKTEATKWYHICRQTGQGSLLEYRWATRELAQWQRAGTENRNRLWHHPYGAGAFRD